MKNVPKQYQRRTMPEKECYNVKHEETKEGIKNYEGKRRECVRRRQRIE
jgi:hypothetical protein